MVQIEDFSPSQIGVHSTRMSALMTFSWMAGHSSAGQPCSVMSVYTPTGISWSTARTTSTVTPWRRITPMAMSARPSVFETSGDRFRVQLTNRALRSEKSHRSCSSNCSEPTVPASSGRSTRHDGRR